jgi:hypothetical protein
MTVFHTTTDADAWGATDAHLGISDVGAGVSGARPIKDASQDVTFRGVKFDQASGVWYGEAARKLKTCDLEDDLWIQGGRGRFVIWCGRRGAAAAARAAVGRPGGRGELGPRGPRLRRTAVEGAPRRRRLRCCGGLAPPNSTPRGSGLYHPRRASWLSLPAPPAAATAAPLPRRAYGQRAGFGFDGIQKHADATCGSMPLQLLGVTKAQAAAAKRAERPAGKAPRAAWAAAPSPGGAAAAAVAAAAAGADDERPLSAAAAGKLLADVLAGYTPRAAPAAAAAAGAYDPDATADPGPPKGVSGMKYPVRQLPDGSWEATMFAPPTKIPGDADTTYMAYYIEVPSDE